MSMFVLREERGSIGKKLQQVEFAQTFYALHLRQVVLLKITATLLNRSKEIYFHMLSVEKSANRMKIVNIGHLIQPELQFLSATSWKIVSNQRINLIP